jgi:hypothetical protein
MILNNAQEAVVPLEKLTDYLLSQSHPEGKSKAKFFRGLGFNEGNVDLFTDSLREEIRSSG